MKDKSIQKRKYILKKAREVFVQKGYLSVTMKDIVDACDISRGGLYLYYSSVHDLFLDVLEADRLEDAEKKIEEETEHYTSMQWIFLFFREQKREILEGRENLSVARYEFYFQNEYPYKEHPMNIQFIKAVQVLEILLKRAVKEQALSCEDVQGTARNIMYALEGLRIRSCICQVTEREIDREIDFLLLPLQKDIQEDVQEGIQEDIQEDVQENRQED